MKKSKIVKNSSKNINYDLDIKKIRVSWCATISKKDKEKINITINSIKNQSIKPYEIIITEGGNISQGRNKYLRKARGDVLAVFDGGCIYEKNWVEKMLKKMIENDADIVIGKVNPFPPKNRIQDFCISRMPDYERFTNQDWSNFIPSNRQIIFKKDVIKKLGLLPEELWRSDDTYWFQKAKREGLKFTYCQEAVVYWEMKTNLKSYLKTVYNDTKCDYQYGITPFSAPKRKEKKLDFVGLAIYLLAIIAKISGIIFGKINFKRKIGLQNHKL